MIEAEVVKVIEETDIPQEVPVSEETTRLSAKKKVFTLTFGVISLLLSMGAATFSMIINLLGISVALTESGIVPMAIFLGVVIIHAIPAIATAVISQKLGAVTALNKVSLALSISSACTSVIVFCGLWVMVLMNG